MCSEQRYVFRLVCCFVFANITLSKLTRNGLDMKRQVNVPMSVASTTKQVPTVLTRRVLKTYKVDIRQKNNTTKIENSITSSPDSIKLTPAHTYNENTDSRQEVRKSGEHLETQIVKESYEPVLIDMPLFNHSQDIVASAQISNLESPTCEPVRWIPTYSPRETGYFMISTCPNTTDAQLRKSCSRAYSIQSDFKNILPVYDQNTLLLYRNRYCALCNNVQEADFELWKAIVKCGVEFYRDIDSYFDFNSHEAFSHNETGTLCNIKFEKPEGKILPLTPCEIVISRFNITGYLKIHDNGSLVYPSYVLYVRNKENDTLSLCYGEIPDITKCFEFGHSEWNDAFKAISISLGLDVISSALSDSGEASKSFSFSGLINLEYQPRLNPKFENYFTVRYKREDGRMSNGSAGNDSNLVCNPFSNLQRGQCINKFEYITDDVIYIINIRIYSDRKRSTKEVFDVRIPLVKTVEEVVKSVVNLTDSTDFICETTLFLKSNALWRSEMLYVYESTFVHGEVEIKIGSSGRHIIQNVADAVQFIHNKAISISFNNQSSIFTITAKDIHQFPKNVTESFNNPFKYNTNETGTSAFDIVSLSKSYKDFSFRDRDNLTIVQIYKSRMAAYSLRCIRGKWNTFNMLHYTSCPKLNLSMSESAVQLNENGISISGQFIDLNQYYFEGTENILVCANVIRDMTLQNHIYPDSINIEVIVSIICISLSLLSLCIAFGTYCYFNELRRSVPGKNTLALITALLFSQVIFLIGSFGSFMRFSLSCVVVGMLVHLSWLFALFYMNVCTYHMFKTLTGMRMVSKSYGVKTCVYYFTYVSSASLLFVLINVVISYATSDTIGYGETHCYISSQLRIMITVGVPVIFVILTNVGMFFAVIVKMRRTSSSLIKNVKHERNDLLIFAKLSTITGVTWIFGLLYAVTNFKGFSYAFIILNASQGVFIIFAFIINRRVFEMFKEVHIKKKNKLSTI